MQKAPSSEARIEIVRRSERDMKFRGLEIFLDGEFLADLGFGDSITRDVAAGDHSLKVTNSLYTKKLDLALKPQEAVYLQVGNEMKGCGGIMTLLLGMGPYKVFLEEVRRETFGSS